MGVVLGLEILESLPVFIKPHVTLVQVSGHMIVMWLFVISLLLIEALLLEGSHGNVQEALSLSEKVEAGVLILWLIIPHSFITESHVIIMWSGYTWRVSLPLGWLIKLMKWVNDSIHSSSDD